MDMKIWQMTNQEMEHVANIVKRYVLAALVEEGKLDWEWADRWAMEHAVVVYSPGIWRRMYDRIKGKKIEAKDGHTFAVVKIVIPKPSENEDEPKKKTHAQPKKKKSGKQKTTPKKKSKKE